MRRHEDAITYDAPAIDTRAYYNPCPVSLCSFFASLFAWHQTRTLML